MTLSSLLPHNRAEKIKEDRGSDWVQSYDMIFLKMVIDVQ